MKRFIEGEARTQVTLLRECLDDYITEENPVRVVDVLSMNLILEHSVSRVSILRQLVVRRTIQQCC